jgi:hypothetical protein
MGAARGKEKRVKYAILIYGNEAAGASASPEQQQAVMDAWWQYEGELQKEEGLRLAGEALQPTSTATSVREQNGDVITTDGPFAETKEQLGGFYLVDAKDLDEAIEIASKVPAARFGTVEVRPIWDM